MNETPYFTSNYYNFDIYQSAKCGNGVKQPTFIGGIPFQDIKTTSSGCIPKKIQNDKYPYVYSALCTACIKGSKGEMICKPQRYNINYVYPEFTEYQKMNSNQQNLRNRLFN